MSRLARATRLLVISLAVTGLSPATQAQSGTAAPPVDPHAGHVMPAPAPEPEPAAVDHSQHAVPAAVDHSQHAAPPAVDHSQHAMPAADAPSQPTTLPDGVRDPHAYANGYAVGTGAYALPGGHAAHMSAHDYSGGFLLDRLESSGTGAGRATDFALDAWYGRDFRRWWLLSEGEKQDGESLNTSTELLASRALSSYWDAVAGVQVNTGDDTRAWLSAGLRGLAPYWFEVDARVLFGESGQSALHLETEYDLRLTQKLILQPMAELSFHGKTLAKESEGRGLSDMNVGLRLRYEFTPQFAPYVGVEHEREFGDTAAFTRQQGLKSRDTRTVLGLRLWF